MIEIIFEPERNFFDFITELHDLYSASDSIPVFARVTEENAKSEACSTLCWTNIQILASDDIVCIN